MSTFSAEKIAQAEKVLNEVRESWLKRPGVTAVDLGFKWHQGEMTDQLSIRVHVTQKKPLTDLPEAEQFPTEIEGIPVDVIEAKYGIQISLEHDPQAGDAAAGRQHPYDNIPLGVSIGNAHTSAGTLGAKVIDVETNQEMILSNWHVMVGTLTPEPLLSIWQPGGVDGGSEADHTIAQLSRSVLGPYDAAVAALTGSRPVQFQTLEGARIETAAPPRLGMLVWKSGRTTGRTVGFVDGIHMTVDVDYENVGTRTLEDVFRIIPRPGGPRAEISQRGDSGSVWVDEASGSAVGLHFAGEIGDQPELALAHDITAVSRHLHFRFPAQPLKQPTAPSRPTRKPKLSWWQRILQFFRNLFK